jgi:hypothetical protein
LGTAQRRDHLVEREAGGSRVGEQACSERAQPQFVLTRGPGPRGFVIMNPNRVLIAASATDPFPTSFIVAR